METTTTTGMRRRKIVVAVDESEESMHALSWCLSNLTSSPNSQIALILLYVKPPPPVFSPMDAAGFLFAGDVTSALQSYGNELVCSVMARADCVLTDFCKNNNNDVNVNVEKKVGKGDAKGVICGMVDKIGADMLVMGCHGYGFFKRALLGSVSNHCSKNVKCTVIVVKRRDN